MSAAARVVPIEAPGDVLSPSSVNTYRSCGAKWFFGRVAKLPDPPTGARTIGSAVHRALGENARQKIETTRDLPTAGVQALYRDAWAELEAETEFRADEDAGQLRAQGEILITTFMDRVAAKIEPAAVELPVGGQIGGVPARGYVDLVDVHGRIIDVKTAARAPSAISPDYRFQVASYCALVPGVGAEAMLVTLTKTKSPQAIEQEFTIGEPDRVEIERMYPAVQRAIRAGVFLPNRGSNLCSRKYCAFWRACQGEFGGEVSE